MTLFRLDTPTEARLATFTARTEKHVADDVAEHGEGNSARTPAQIRAAKGAATRRAKAEAAS